MGTIKDGGGEMALNLPNFLSAPIVANDYSGLRDALENYAKGQQIVYQPMQMQADLQLKRAQAMRAPFMGMTGPAQELFSIEIARRQLGADNPLVKRMENAYALQQQNIQSQIANRDMLTESAPKRFSTPITKTQLELEEARRGYLPGSAGAVQLSPDQQKYFVGMLENKSLKDSTDTKSREKALYASNIDKTIASFNVKDLTRFAGPVGAIKKKIEQGKALTQSESEDYQKYEKARTAVELLASQVRQFYGESIQPSVREHLEELSDPSSWSNNPKLAEQKFNQFRSILEKETQTYKNALRGPQEYGASGYDAVVKGGQQPDYSHMSDEELLRALRE